MFKNILKKAASLIKKIPFIIPAFIAVLIFLILPFSPWVAEYVFARGLFKILSAPISAVTSVIPFSLTEIAVILSIPAVISLSVLFILQLRKACRKRNILKKWGKYAGWLISCMLLLYMIMHGANYYRYKIDVLVGLDDVVLFENGNKKEVMTQQLITVCEDLITKAAKEREALNEDENGCMVLSTSIYHTLQQAPKMFENIEKEYPFLQGGALAAKPVMLSHYWSYTGIAGMYFPFWCEANINIDVPQSSIPSTVMHELVHTKGFAREGDCNFIAYLACINSDSAEYRYSGYLMAFIYCSNELFNINKIEWTGFMGTLPDKVRMDISQRGGYWSQFNENSVQEVSTSINNAFLSSQGESDGVQSYSNIVELILKDYKKNGLI